MPQIWKKAISREEKHHEQGVKNVYIERESLSPNEHKIFDLACVADINKMNKEIDKKVELI